MATATQALYEKKEWLLQAEGKYWDPDNAHGIQCVDLIDQYAQDIFGVHWTKSVGPVEGAKDLWKAPGEFWTWIANRPDPKWVPLPGDVLVYSGTGNDRRNLSWYGHTAIAIEERVPAPYVLQQDGAAQYLSAHRATLTWYSPVYGIITGWLRPRPEKVLYTGADRRLAPKVISPERVHVVKAGETLNMIAQKYNTNLPALLAKNSYIKNMNYLNIGDRVNY